ncbi:hypothetical protein PRIPAC_88239, partial [Pristionchus pacificus]|uniref:Uncharacterized protein n=1 Tax=Pristionchus pacificus TaxID=54126 RepID=A0A2A6CVE1_PRIPA
MENLQANSMRKEAKEADGGEEEGSGGAMKEERASVDDPWEWSPDHLETVFGPDIAVAVSPLVVEESSLARATGRSFVLHAIAGEAEMDLCIGPATVNRASALVVEATGSQLNISLVRAVGSWEDASSARALGARVHALASCHHADAASAHPLTLKRAAAAVRTKEEKANVEKELSKAKEAELASPPQQLQPGDDPTWLEVVPLEEWPAPVAASSPIKGRPSELQQLQPVRGKEEATAHSPQQLQPSQPGWDASFDAWCTAMSAPTPSTPAKRAASPKESVDAKK